MGKGKEQTVKKIERAEKHSEEMECESPSTRGSGLLVILLVMF